MHRHNVLISFVAAVWALAAEPAAAQGWTMVDTEGTGGAGAAVCAAPAAEGDEPPCFRFTCENDNPLHYELALFGPAAAGQPEELAVEVQIDGRASGLLLFARGTEADGITDFAAPFDPRLQRALIDALRRGSRAELSIQSPTDPIAVPLSLRGSSKALGAVMETCPMPEVPLNDPAAVVLDEIVRQCGSLGGSVSMEPGFERREDLDGDGREDVVIDYAAAVCSEMASLYCGSGGCTVGFFLSRDEGYERIFDGVIRGYTSKPEGLLALDLHGTACGLYGFEACRKVFRISDDSFALVEEIAGARAEAAQTADGMSANAGEQTGASATQNVQPTASADPGPTTAEASAEAPGFGLEMVGEGGAVLLPAEGESLPDDLEDTPLEATTPDGG